LIYVPPHTPARSGRDADVLMERFNCAMVDEDYGDAQEAVKLFAEGDISGLHKDQIVFALQKRINEVWYCFTKSRMQLSSSCFSQFNGVCGKCVGG
jgi:hypothetical protein